MDIQVQEIQGKLICKKYNHNEQIMMVVMDGSVSIKDRLLCSKCLSLQRSIVKILGIDQVKDMIKEIGTQKDKQNQQTRTKDLIILKDFQQKMKELQTRMIQNFDQILRNTQELIVDFESQTNETQLMSLLKGLENLNKSNSIQNKDEEQFTKTCQSFLLKIETILKKLQNTNDIVKASDLLKSMFQNNPQMKIIRDYPTPQFAQQQIQISTNFYSQSSIKEQIDKYNISQIELIHSIKQEESCFSIAFNYNGSLMVSGCNEFIKIWKFDQGNIKELKKLKGHLSNIMCLVFSKKQNFLISGSHDEPIQCWKELRNDEWVSYKPKELIKTIIRLIINNKEDELIACSQDIIQVWSINSQLNQIVLIYSLKTDDQLWDISMNQSESQLISCGIFCKIKLWKKGIDKKWLYDKEIEFQYYGFRILFINDFQIVWQQYGCGISHLFEIKNKELIIRPELNVQLNSESGDCEGFPSIFNQKRQLILQKHNKFVYFLKQQKDGKLKLVSDPIDCFDLKNFGTLSENGEYLIVHNQDTNEFRIHKISYE